MTKIWYLYLFKLHLKMFLFVLFSIFTVYCLIDLSIHGLKFVSNSDANLLEIFKYYGNNFANHLDFFFPLTLLLASLKVLLDLSRHHELLALQASGLSQKKILSPFFLFAAMLSMISYANHEWIAPKSGGAADTFKEKSQKKKKKEPRIFSAALEDGSELIYQKYDRKKLELFDVYWIKSPKDIWHIKTFSLQNEHPTGLFVDHFEKDQSGKIRKTNSFDKHTFLDCNVQKEINLQKFIPYDNRSLSALFKQSMQNTSEKKFASIYLHHKLATPLLSFAVLCLIFPFALQYSRTKKVILLISASLFGLVSFITILDGMLILGENQVVSGFFAIWTPMSLLFLLSLFSLRKAR